MPGYAKKRSLRNASVCDLIKPSPLGKPKKRRRFLTRKEHAVGVLFAFMMLAYFSSISEGSHMEGAS